MHSHAIGLPFFVNSWYQRHIAELLIVQISMHIMQSGRCMILTMEIFILLANRAGRCQTGQAKIPWNCFVSQHCWTWARWHHIRFMARATLAGHFINQFITSFSIKPRNLNDQFSYGSSLLHLFFKKKIVRGHNKFNRELINEFINVSSYFSAHWTLVQFIVANAQPNWLDEQTRLITEHDWIALHSTNHRFVCFVLSFEVCNRLCVVESTSQLYSVYIFHILAHSHTAFRCFFCLFLFHKEIQRCEPNK